MLLTALLIRFIFHISKIMLLRVFHLSIPVRQINDFLNILLLVAECGHSVLYNILLIFFTGTNDSYVMIEPTNFKTSFSVAKLKSNEIRGPVCMRFFFYLYGNETGTLKVAIQSLTTTYEHVVFTRWGNHGNKWNFAKIYLNFSSSDVYQVSCEY